MNVNANRTDKWTPCAPGELQTFGRKAKAQSRLRGMTRVAGAAVVVLCVGGLTVWSVSRLTGERENYFGGIACHEVRANLEAYAMGTLSAELTERLETHLSECPACQEFRKLMSQQQVSTESSHTARCSCPHCRVLVSYASETYPESSAPTHLIDEIRLAYFPPQ
jgi:hypothetical protein